MKQAQSRSFKVCAQVGCKRLPLRFPKAKGCCILHAQLDKDLSKFREAIKEVIDEAEKSGSGYCDFSGCYFPANHNCQELEEAFQFNCSFEEATFTGDAAFGNTQFSRNVDFLRAKFIGNADFGKAVFAGDADFTEAEFFKNADFAAAEFFRNADFSDVQFVGDVRFRLSRFLGDASFWGTQFSKDVDFMQVEFSHDADFEGARFLQTADFSHVLSSGRILFQRVSVSKPERIIFHHLDLSRASFLDTDLRHIDFHDVSWGIVPPRMKLRRLRLALYDEFEIRSKIDMAKVERLYRQLKQNFENQRDYSRAGAFYYGEMEMKRRQQGALGQLPFIIYRLLSGYGERYGQALIMLIGMWIAFALLFMLLGYNELRGEIVHRILAWEPSALVETLEDFKKSLIHSFKI